MRLILICLLILCSFNSGCNGAYVPPPFRNGRPLGGFLGVPYENVTENSGNAADEVRHDGVKGT